MSMVMLELPNRKELDNISASYGRRWIGMGASAIAIATIRERLDTDYMFVDMSEKKDG